MALLCTVFRNFLSPHRDTRRTLPTHPLLVLLTISNSLSDLTERSSRGELKRLEDRCHLLIGIAGYVLWVLRGGRDASLTLLGESGFVCLSRESLKIGKRPRKSSRTLKFVNNVKATLMSIWWNCPRSAVPSELKNRDPYEKEAGTRSLLLT